jgi:two-component system sensor histidine kinase QseC
MQDRDDETPELEPVRILNTVFENNGKYYELQIINSMLEEDDLVKELLIETIGIYLFLIIAIILINNYVLKRLWHPFYALLHQLKYYRIGKKFPEIKTDTQEFSDLQKAVNELLLHNMELFKKQKEFISNASHELQTPLAIAINKMEILIEKGNLNIIQAEAIADTLNIMERLVKLNKSLLLLTKIENKQFLNNQKVCINDVVKQCVNDLEDIMSYKNIQLNLTAKSILTVEIDAALAQIAVANLLRNAIFHNIYSGVVNITIMNNCLQICNTGLNRAIDSQKIFSRFHKTQEQSNGSGLGLAILKAICDLYRFNISYRFEVNEHIFEIKLK